MNAADHALENKVTASLLFRTKAARLADVTPEKFDALAPFLVKGFAASFPKADADNVLAELRIQYNGARLMAAAPAITSRT
jgi:hypothetical protein